MRTLLVILVSLGILAAAAAPGACQPPPPPPPVVGPSPASPGTEAKRISITFENQPVRQALLDIAKQADIGILVAESVPETRKVTAVFRNVPAAEAISLIVSRASLKSDHVGGTLVIEAAAPVAAVSYPTGYATPGFRPRTSAMSAVEWHLVPMTLVDLKTEQATVAEAMAVIDKQLADCRIVVSEAVSKDIKITANVFKMRFYDVMQMLLDQTGLTMSIERPADPDEKTTIHVVPQPKIEVTGAPGYGGYGAYGGRYGGYGGRYGGYGSRTLNDLFSTDRSDGVGEYKPFELVVPGAPAAACAKCGAPMQQDWRFCPRCGAERKAE